MTEDAAASKCRLPNRPDFIYFQSADNPALVSYSLLLFYQQCHLEVRSDERPAVASNSLIPQSSNIEITSGLAITIPKTKPYPDLQRKLWSNSRWAFS